MQCLVFVSEPFFCGLNQVFHLAFRATQPLRALQPGSAMTTSSVELPWALLTRILQLVPLQQRLSSCALVCKSWAAAAVSATSSITFSTPKSLSTISSKARCRKWLQQHGQTVHSLDLTLTGDTSYLTLIQDIYGEASEEEDSYEDENVVAILSKGVGPYGVERTVSLDTSCFKLPSLQLQHLTSLSLDGASLPSLSPCSQPRQQQQGPSGSVEGSHCSSSTAALLPQLLELKLVKCTVARQADLQQLVCATGFTKLHVEQLSVPHEASPPVAGWQLQQDRYEYDRQAEKRVLVTASAVGQALQLCSNLVSLKLVIVYEDMDRFAPSPLVGLSSLVKLQELDIDIPPNATADFLPPLPAGITHMSLCGCDSVRMPSEQAALQQVPSLQQLRSLRLYSISLDAGTFSSMTHMSVLQLTAAIFDVKGLSHMTQLQQLVLDDCRLFKSAGAAARAGGFLLHSLSMADKARSADAESVLAAIGHLTQLRVLEVASRSGGNVGERDYDAAGFALLDAPVSAFSALTASGQLQRLRLHGFQYGAVPIGAEQLAAHMFPAGRQRTQLTALVLSSDFFVFRSGYWCLTAADMQSIASSCPCLRSLRLEGLVVPHTDLSPLLQLSQCRSLSVGGRAFDDRAVEVVAQMTQLTSLTWYCSTGFSSLGLNQLTALTNLQQLVLAPVFKPEENPLATSYSTYKEEVEEVETDIWALLDSRRTVLTDQGAVATPVWRQIDELCDRSSVVAPLRLKQLRTDKQQLQTRLEQQEQAIGQLQDEVAQLRAEVDRWRSTQG